MNATITTRYVNIALGSFWCERWKQLFAFLLYQIVQIIPLSKTSNVLCEGWQPKTTSALASGTNLKTEDFCDSNKLGFGLWGINYCRFCNHLVQLLI